uniref:Uncharacterized protein n=1 Tax=Arundo donax TaxID=35708 RepID=A0A0A9A5A2_ARUDO
MSNMRRCTISCLNRSTISDRLAGNQLGLIRCHMKRSP